MTSVDQSDDPDAPEEAVQAVADHLTEALEAFLGAHMPAPGGQPGPGGMTRRPCWPGSPSSMRRSCRTSRMGSSLRLRRRSSRCRCRSFKEALDVLYEEEEEEDADAR